MAEDSEKDSKPAINWTKILTGALGAALLGLQGINLSEVAHGNQSGEKRMEVLEQLLHISNDMKDLLKTQTHILENGAATLENDDRAFRHQEQILETLRQAIAERRELLEKIHPPLVNPTPN